MELTRDQGEAISKLPFKCAGGWFITLEEVLEQVPAGTPANQIVLSFDYDEDEILIRVLDAPVE